KRKAGIRSKTSATVGRGSISGRPITSSTRSCGCFSSGTCTDSSPRTTTSSSKRRSSRRSPTPGRESNKRWLTPAAEYDRVAMTAGNCGFSIAPIRPDGAGIVARTLHHVEDMSVDTLAAGVPWSEFETFPQYLDAVERRGASLNFGCYVGHTAVRLYVMGDDA